MVTMVYTTWLMTKTLLANPDSESKSSLAPRNPCFWQNFLRILFKEYFLSRVKYRMLVMISWSASKRDFNTISVNSKTSWKSWKNFAAFLSNFLFCWQLWVPVPDKNCPNIREIFLQFYFVQLSIFFSIFLFFSIFNFVRIFNFHFVQSCKKFSRILDNFCLEIKIVNKIKKWTK